MRKFSKKEIIRPAATKFFTAYLTLQSMLEARKPLESIVMYDITTIRPLVQVLGMTRRSLLWNAMDEVKEIIDNNLGEEEGNCREIWNIIDDMLELKLHQHLHAISCHLNPQYQYAVLR
ncbi:hypothetical protein M5K25_024104 [Dendrobium thyrsiflorum]|uniref:Uncharacterized protein n=1 Tax=Dendrobium thyrsiflorum TaxID=117978 RepID=A0ABD0U122_DENTH